MKSKYNISREPYKAHYRMILFTLYFDIPGIKTGFVCAFSTVMGIFSIIIPSELLTVIACISYVFNILFVIYRFVRDRPRDARELTNKEWQLIQELRHQDNKHLEAQENLIEVFNHENPTDENEKNDSEITKGV